MRWKWPWLIENLIKHWSMEFLTCSSFFHFRFKKLILFIVYSVKSIFETALERSNYYWEFVATKSEASVASRHKLSYEPQKQMGWSSFSGFREAEFSKTVEFLKWVHAYTENFSSQIWLISSSCPLSNNNFVHILIICIAQDSPLSCWFFFRGYMAPEYATRGYLTDKADVYSFGVVALEIVSGKSNANYRPKQESVYLLDWVNNCFLLILSALFFLTICADNEKRVSGFTSDCRLMSCTSRETFWSWWIQVLDQTTQRRRWWGCWTWPSYAPTSLPLSGHPCPL